MAGAEETSSPIRQVIAQWRAKARAVSWADGWIYNKCADELAAVLDALPQRTDPEPDLPADECTTAAMLRKVATHLRSRHFVIPVTHDDNAESWAAGLERRADIIEARHPELYPPRSAAPYRPPDERREPWDDVWRVVGEFYQDGHVSLILCDELAAALRRAQEALSTPPAIPAEASERSKANGEDA